MHVQAMGADRGGGVSRTMAANQRSINGVSFSFSPFTSCRTDVFFPSLYGMQQIELAIFCFLLISEQDAVIH